MRDLMLMMIIKKKDRKRFNMERKEEKWKWGKELKSGKDKTLWRGIKREGGKKKENK